MRDDRTSESTRALAFLSFCPVPASKAFHVSKYYLVTGWYEDSEGSMTHTQSSTFDNKPSIDELMKQLIATGVSYSQKGEGAMRMAFSIRFELVTQKRSGQDFQFLQELWFRQPVQGWHD